MSDFLDRYLHFCGNSEVPRSFQLFAGLSLLASSVADRVWMLRDAGGSRIFPNLYIFLIGPSGSGKEKAITTAARFAEGVSNMGLFVSTGVTKQFLIDHLSRKPADLNEPTNVLWLVTEELGMSIPSKELGKDLIKFMTGHYIPSGLTTREGTRMHGPKVLKDPMLNWLAGTTDEWLMQSVDKDAILGGFFARVLSVRGKRDGSIRFAEMQYPPDREQVREELRLRLEMYTHLHAQFVRTPAAQAYYKDWYESHLHRPSPNDQLMEAAFNRTDEMVHRLALLLKLASMEDIPGFYTDIPVDVCHFHEAIQMWHAVMQDVPETIKRAASTKESEDVDSVADLVRRNKKLDHSTLLRRAGNRGMNASRVASGLKELEGRGDIKLDLEPVSHGKTRRIYVWVGA